MKAVLFVLSLILSASSYASESVLPPANLPPAPTTDETVEPSLLAGLSSMRLSKIESPDVTCRKDHGIIALKFEAGKERVWVGHADEDTAADLTVKDVKGKCPACQITAEFSLADESQLFVYELAKGSKGHLNLKVSARTEKGALETLEKIEDCKK